MAMQPLLDQYRMGDLVLPNRIVGRRSRARAPVPTITFPRPCKPSITFSARRPA